MEPWTPMYSHNDIHVNLWLSWAIPLLWDTLQNPRWDISLSSWVIHMLTIPSLSLTVLFFFLVEMLRHPHYSHLCLDRRWWMPSHRDGPKNISPLSEEQIPFLSYLVPCQTFWWTCKLSLWSPCYRWRLSNPKVHRTVRSDYDTLMT